jgi:hypothetical protein
MRMLLLWSGPVLEAAVLAGLIVRRRLHYAYLLPVFLLAALVPGLAVALAPSVFTWHVWLLQEALHAALLLGLGVEVSVRMMARLRGPAATMVFLGLVLAAATGSVLRAAPQRYVLFEVVPRVLAGTAGLYVGAFLVQWFFAVPVDRLHQAILLGLSPYMLVYAITWGRVTSAAGVAVADVVNPLMFLFALLVLLQAAWQTEDNPSAPHWLLSFLWPWRRWSSRSR